MFLRFAEKAIVTLGSSRCTPRDRAVAAVLTLSPARERASAVSKRRSTFGSV